MDRQQILYERLEAIFDAQHLVTKLQVGLRDLDHVDEYEKLERVWSYLEDITQELR